MEENKITLTRALAELKLLKDRISKKIMDGKFIDFYRRVDDKLKFNPLIPVKEFESTAKSNIDSINALIERSVSMRVAVQRANVNTIIRVNGREMCIAEAIERKRHLEVLRQLLASMVKQQQSVLTAANANQQAMEKTVKEMYEKATGSEGNKTQEYYEAFSRPLIEKNESVILDPLQLAKKIEALETEIEDFGHSLDFALSEINSQTKVEVK